MFIEVFFIGAFIEIVDQCFSDAFINEDFSAIDLTFFTIFEFEFIQCLMERVNMKVIRDDITTLQVDAIVNAANTSLLGGGGVDGAIHQAAGIELLEACKRLEGCRVGEAKITSGFKLPARFVIHAVGPIWAGGFLGEKKILASAYQKSLEIATANQCETIAFPNISTGVYRFPKHKAAKIAIHQVKDYFKSNNTALKTVFFVCFDQRNYNIYQQILNGYYVKN